MAVKTKVSGHKSNMRRISYADNFDTMERLLDAFTLPEYDAFSNERVHYGIMM